MSKVVFIKQNSPKIRAKLMEAGFWVCPCAEFEEAIWLANYPDNKRLESDIHGVGHTDDSLKELPPLERIQKWLTWDRWFSKEREFYDTVDEFLKHYKPKKN